ncbi:alpha/beta hydrolase family protein [Indioceanicola profundi]|uniref:hypothetical protein n=1 Tax=Indioceanicola profundi TaxID=2220096 RepID=UPI001CEE0264|nr:hypothetical protein [Indioceanicola profundi]
MRRSITGVLTAVSAFCLMAAAPLSVEAKGGSNQGRGHSPLILKDQGSFFVGGETMSRGPDDDITVGQMYVEYMIPATKRRRLPVVMLHGCCLTGKTYETTPDGRMGWDEYFVRKGYPVYVPDQVGRGRSGFNATIYEQVRAGERPLSDLPRINQASYQRAWQIFRFGPEYDQLFPGQQFPEDGFDELFQQMVPDLIGWLPTPNPTWARLATLSDNLNGAILMGHSQSGFFPQRAALSENATNDIKGLISLEPGNCAATALTDQEYESLARIPTLVVFGDFIEEDTSGIWANALRDCRQYAERINAEGGDAAVVFLPDVGLHGNTHMFMQDRNHLRVADFLLQWIRDHVDHRHGDKRGK